MLLPTRMFLCLAIYSRQATRTARLRSRVHYTLGRGAISLRGTDPPFVGLGISLLTPKGGVVLWLTRTREGLLHPGIAFGLIADTTGHLNPDTARLS
jgi:hypothetical protein